MLGGKIGQVKTFNDRISTHRVQFVLVCEITLGAELANSLRLPHFISGES